MQLNDLYSILEKLDIDTTFLTALDTGQMQIPCPLSPWLHEKKEDRHPSMSLKWDGAPVLYKCFSCGEGGKLADLVDSFAHFSKRDSLKDLALYLIDHDKPTLLDTVEVACNRVQDIGEKIAPSKPQILNINLADRFIPFLASAECREYLKKRGISEEAGMAHDLWHDYQQQRIVYPVKTLEGHLVGAVGRILDDELNAPRYYNYFGFRVGKCLGGLPLVKEDSDRVFVVEGFFDILKSYQWAQEFNADVVCTFHAELSKYQADQLIAMGKSTSFWFDQDKAGQNGYDKAQEALHGKLISLRRAEWEGNIDVGEMPQEMFRSIYAAL